MQMLHAHRTVRDGMQFLHSLATGTRWLCTCCKLLPATSLFSHSGPPSQRMLSF